MVWAILRRAPNKAYLELEDQPAPRVVYTFSLEMQRNRRAPIVMKKVGWVVGYSIHIINARNSLNEGAAINGEMLAIDGNVCSLRKSFIASAIGWGTPIIETLFGPLRDWIYPRTLRSSRVKNAMARRATR